MESEKVKEIKKALEENANNSEHTHLAYIEDYRVKLVAYRDILTLINELESENERLRKEVVSEWKDRRKAEEDLHKTQWNYKIGLGQSRKRNKELKDRIAELEKENEILKGTKDRLTFVDRINIVNNAVEIQLKQFAERIKMEFYYQFDELIPSIMADKIDETLKEFL